MFLGWLVAPAAGGAGDSGCRRGLGLVKAGGFRLAIFVACEVGWVMEIARVVPWVGLQ